MEALGTKVLGSSEAVDNDVGGSWGQSSANVSGECIMVLDDYVKIVKHSQNFALESLG